MKIIWNEQTGLQITRETLQKKTVGKPGGFFSVIDSSMVYKLKKKKKHMNNYRPWVAGLRIEDTVRHKNVSKRDVGSVSGLPFDNFLK